MLRYILFLFLFITSGNLVHAQDVDARSPHPNGKSTGKQREAEKKKEKQKKELDNAIKEGKKQHYKHQDKSTRKRMKEGKRKSSKWQKNDREFFLKRWFSKKHR